MSLEMSKSHLVEDRVKDRKQMCNRVTEEMEDLHGRKDAFQDWVLPLFYLRRRVGKSPDGHDHMGIKDYRLQKWHQKPSSGKHPCALLRSSRQEE